MGLRGAVNFGLPPGMPETTFEPYNVSFLTFDIGPRWLLDVTLDGGKRGVTLDLEPDLPMVIHLLTLGGY
jgi:hypothetical protein